jgi:hypothetical protein
MKPTSATNLISWLTQEWPGNPALKLLCCAKYFINPFNGKQVPVFIFGTGKDGHFNYCVSAGASSDYSYTGLVYADTLEQAQSEVDKIYTDKKLFK